MHIVPLHSVCFAFGKDEPARLAVMGKFARTEWIVPDKVRAEIAGPEYRSSIDHIVRDELEHRITMRLRLGYRMVVDAEGLDKATRIHLIEKAKAFGVPVFALICAETENMAYRGAEIIDARATDIELVEALPTRGAAEYLSARYCGVTVVGDVHGSHNSLLSSITWARQRGHYLVCLGDVVDYGPGSLECAEELYRLATRGEATLITGNHERKIMRWIDGYRVRLSDGNRVTTMGLMSLSDDARTRWTGRFRGLFQTSRLVLRVSNLTFAHAAVHPHYWASEEINQTIENFAFFGEIDTQKSKTDRPIPSYRWTDAVPARHFAVVGHNIRSREFPVLQTNKRGGNALFLDTGAGKGGRLSSADFRFAPEGLKLKNFNIY